MSGERGSVTLVMAAVLAVAVVMTLGAVDVWQVLRARAQAQVAADAAALAAAQGLAIPGTESPVESAARFAEFNGATLIACDCATASTEASVTVQRGVGELALFPDDLSIEAAALAATIYPATLPPPQPP